MAAFRWNVIAPLFARDLSPEERCRERRRVLEQEHPDPYRGPRRISASALIRWEKAYMHSGIRWLAPRARHDAGSLKAFPEPVLLRAIELRREMPNRILRHLVEFLKKEFPHYAHQITRPTLDRHLRTRGWSMATLRKTAPSFITFEAPCCNSLWIGDVLHGPDVVCQDGSIRRVKIFGWISVYLSLISSTLGINKIHSTPGYAPSRGKIERFFRTLCQGVVKIST